MSKMILATLVLIGQVANAQGEQKFRAWEEACAAATSTVAEGDLIFLDIPNVIFRHVAEGTKTWTSHVGIVFKDKSGNWIVAESTIPLSKEVPLCKFLETSSEYSFEIKRLSRPLGSEEIAKLHSMANLLLNRFYTFGFDFDSNGLFCSKFVYLTYRSIDVEVGKPQTFHQLLADNPKASLNFWRLWFLGSIPWGRRTITPASQLNDLKFLSVLKGS
jgi:hypothetical protein